MSTYFNGISSEIQADSSSGLQTLYLMTPQNYIDQGHHFVGVPIPVGSNSDHDHLSRSSSSSLSRFHYNHLWGGGPAAAATDNCSIPASGTHQGLSLSLSYREQGLSSGTMIHGPVINGGREDTSASNGLVMRSKYLKAAQELLDEVVNVGKGVIDYQVAAEGGGGGESERREKIGEEGSGGGETTGKRGGTELTTVQRQELQMKKAKLVNMLDEVEQRYKEYHNQMQIVVSSFEQAAGIGSTKSYTALALQTISKQFRCLKDAISAQIKAAASSLGEDVDGATGAEGYSRLKFVDHQLRQQKALQQLGMMPPPHHHNAWRPQRGLPESAVSVLRAWLFEHFLHPYPKDSDKHMLAKQTGLTRSQVSNWFINARVRLWKPMVEEMYLEEMKQHDQESSSTINGKNTTVINTREPNKELLPGESKSQTLIHHQTSSTFPSEPQLLHIPNHVYTTSQAKGLVLDPPRSPKKPKPSSNNNNNVNIGGGSFGAYNINPLIDDHHHQIGVDQFDHDQLVAAGFHDFLSNQMGMNMGTAVQASHYGGMMSSVSPPHSSIMINGYESINSTIMNNNRKRFAAPLLPDFVA